MNSEILRLREHIRAAFYTAHAQPPRWLTMSQERARDQIKMADMEKLLVYTLNGLGGARERSDEPFEVFIVGEGKHGKSTLINALLGRNIAPTDRLPKTWCFNRYIAASSPALHVRLYVQGDLEQHSHLKQRIGKKMGESRGLAEYHVQHSIAEFIVAEEERLWSEARACEKIYVSPIMEMEWQTPLNKALLPGLRLVDTQGIGQLHSDREHRHYLKWQYERADAVLWILAQDKIGASTTEEEIREARRYAKPVILVLNKWDEIRGDSSRQLARARELYGTWVNAIVPFSALDAFLSVEPDEYAYSERDKRRLNRAGISDWRDLRSSSGLDHLNKVFGEMVGHKASQIRNAQTYSAARQKQYEYRAVMKKRRQEIEQNLHQYQSVHKHILQSTKENTTRVRQEFEILHQQALKKIEANSEQIVWGNRLLARSVLQLDIISADIQETQHRLTQHCTNCFAEVVLEAHLNRRYHEGEFASNSRTTFTQHHLSLSDPNVSVAQVKADWKMEIPIDFWNDLSRGARWLLSHFSQEARESLTTEDEDIRRKVTDLCRQQLQQHINHAIESFDVPLQEVHSELMKDLHKHINALGGVQSLERAMPQIDKALEIVAIEPLFVSIPVKVMRAWNWPKSLDSGRKA